MIKRVLAPVALTASTLLVACGGAPPPAVPTAAGVEAPPELVLVWVGRGEAHIRDKDKNEWRRAAAFDYEFTVEQRRYPDHWESIKHMKRRHPAYDGSAGPREQTLYFRLELGAPDGAGAMPVTILSTLGRGEGKADREYRTAELTLHADVSRFAPFDTYRIAQSYRYEEGKLVETVRLDKGAAPWVRNDEVAVLYAPHAFDHPPTTR